MTRFSTPAGARWRATAFAAILSCTPPIAAQQAGSASEVSDRSGAASAPQASRAPQADTPGAQQLPPVTVQGNYDNAVGTSDAASEAPSPLT